MKHVAVLVLLIPTLALGSPPFLVTDLQPGPGDADISSPRAADTTLVFRRSGLGLWRSDATEAGTIQLLNAETDDLTTHGNNVFFTRLSTSPPWEDLWSTDGTAPGTAFVATITGTQTCPIFSPCTPNSPIPDIFTPAGSLLFFRESTWSVWRSDGTELGTSRIVSYSGEHCSTGCLCCFPIGIALTPFVPVNERIYFTSLGFSLGTLPLIVADSAGVTEVMPSDNVLAFRGVLGRLFIVTEGGMGRVLMVLDGAGSHIVGPIGSPLAFPTQLTAAGGILYLMFDEGTATASLWRTDGTPGGTFKLLDTDATQLTAVGGRLFFRRLSVGGDELWTSDGTVAGTTLVLALPPSQLTDVGGDLYFVTSDAANGEELWTSDGTPGGTAPVADIVPGPDSSSPAELTAACGRLYFTATTPATGRELWALDLTPGVCDPVDEASCTSDADCDDGIPCTVNTCDLTTGCTSTLNHAVCNDNKPCTSDVCTDNGCVGIPVTCCTNDPGCDDANPCTDDVCNTATGDCTSTPFACCSDAECDDEDLCTTDTCDPVNGCASVPLPGLEAVTCVLGGTGSEAAQCPEETIPPRVARRLDRIRSLVDAAIASTRPLSAQNRIRSAVRRLDRLAVTIGREAARGRISPTCSQALVDMVTFARDRADAWYQSQ